MMDILLFNSFSFETEGNVGQLCQNLCRLIRQGIYYDTFKILNTKWLCLVNNIVTAMNSVKMRCSVFRIYPCYVAGILNSVKAINLYVLCSEMVNYLDYIKKCVTVKKCTISQGGDIFQLSYCGEIIYISFEAKILFEKHPSDQVFAYAVLKNIRLKSLAYGILCVNSRLTYITNQVLISRHDCISDMLAYDINVPRRLADCKLHATYCSERPYKRFATEILFCTKQSHRWYWLRDVYANCV